MKRWVMIEEIFSLREDIRLDIIIDTTQHSDWEQVRGLVDYFYEEMRIMHGILTTWIRDILRYIVAHAGADDTGARATSAGMARMLEAYPLGQAGRERCREAIAAGDATSSVDWLDRMRLEFKNPHEMLVAWIQDLLTYVAATWGEEAVLDSILETHQSIWGDRYARWDQMTPHEKLALTVEGMRGGHFSGRQPISPPMIWRAPCADVRARARPAGSAGSSSGG